MYIIYKTYIISFKSYIYIISFKSNIYDALLLQYLNIYLSIGPPVYFVVTEGFDFSDIDNQNLLCSSAGCNFDSMLTQVFVSSLKPNV